MSLPTPRPGILNIKPYKPGASDAPGAAEIHKLSSNESALGASPKAVEACKAAADALYLYPDGGASALREKIGDVHGLDPARIVCGAGSDELLQLLCRAYLGPGDNIVQSAHGFLVYAIAAMGCGAETRFAPEKNLTGDVDALLEQVDENTRIVFIANPNNPTGTYIPDTDIRRLRAALREDVLLVLDAAYAEYMEEADYNAGEKLVDECDNVVMTRTFSKIYGLAALRLGWAYCPPAVADVLNRIRGPFNVTSAGLAGAVAALADQDWVARCRADNARNRAALVEAVEALGNKGLRAVPSAANFVLVTFPEAGPHTAEAANAYLTERGFLTRWLPNQGLGNALRISIGTDEETQAVIAALRAFLA